MRFANEFDIPFAGLKEGKHQFQYEINNSFFENFEYKEFNDAKVQVIIAFQKKSNLLELGFNAKGTVNVNCDLSNEPYDQQVKGKLDLVVKFGEVFNDESDELLILPHGEHTLNVAQYIYEMIVLAVPAKRVHPGIKDGSLNSEILKKIKELSPKETQQNSNIDPRWDTLKKLLTDKE